MPIAGTSPLKTNATTNGLLDLSGLDGTDGFVLNGVTLNDSTGRSVSSAGDFNGDGFDDFLIGANTASGNGVAYLVFGTDRGFPSSVDLSTLDGSNGFRLVGEAAGDFLGAGSPGVSAAGDVNGDEFDDIILGDLLWNGGDGAAYVFFGTDQALGRALSLK